MQEMFTTAEFSLLVSFFLWAVLLLAGYFTEKKSGGFFLAISGFILLHMEAQLVSYLSVFSLAFITPLALYLIFIGFYKLLYKKAKGESVASP